MIRELIAGQFRKPRGFFGQFIGKGMARHNEYEALWTVSLLNIKPEDHLLEIGFGPGVAVKQASQKAYNGLVAGIDYSETMVSAARKLNSSAVKEGRVDLRHGNVSSLPFEDESFDKAYSIHSIYFWPDPLTCLKELMRVLKPGGTLAITILPKEKWRLPSPDVYTLYHSSQIADLFTQAGFRDVRIEVSPEPERSKCESILGIK